MSAGPLAHFHFFCPSRHSAENVRLNLFRFLRHKLHFILFLQLNDSCKYFYLKALKKSATHKELYCFLSNFNQVICSHFWCLLLSLKMHENVSFKMRSVPADVLEDEVRWSRSSAVRMTPLCHFLLPSLLLPLLLWRFPSASASNVLRSNASRTNRHSWRLPREKLFI